MDEKSDLELRGEVNFAFQDFLYDLNLWTLIGGGPSVDVLRKLVDAYFNSERKLKIPHILVCGPEGSGKRTVSHSLINSLAIENVAFLEAKYLDFLISSKYFFSNSYDKAVIIGSAERLTKSEENIIWQYLAFGKCIYGKYNSNEYEIIHYNGALILTASKKELVAKEILQNIDICVELEPYQDFQIRKILEQRLKYIKIDYSQESFNLLIYSSGNKIGNLIQILKLGIINMMGDGRNELLKSDIEWGIEGI